jgi:hypothetical protein
MTDPVTYPQREAGNGRTFEITKTGNGYRLDETTDGLTFVTNATSLSEARRVAQALIAEGHPTHHEDAILDAFNEGIKALDLRRHPRNVRAAQIEHLGLVIFPGLDASITIDDGTLEATIGPDAEVVYRGALAGSAVAAIIARFATEDALNQILDAGHRSHATQSIIDDAYGALATIRARNHL